MWNTRGDIIPLTDDVREEVLAEVAQLNEQGLRSRCQLQIRA